jgi:hypothetical protein
MESSGVLKQEIKVQKKTRMIDGRRKSKRDERRRKREDSRSHTYPT